MRQKATVGAWLVWLLMAAVFFVILGAMYHQMPLVTPDCVPIAEPEQGSYQSPYEDCVLVRRSFIAIGTWLDTHSAFVAALATIAIAYFTLTLKRATDRLWQAAERDLEAFKTATDQQIIEMGSHVTEARRAADAMQSVALEMAKGAQAQILAANATSDSARASWDTAKAMREAADAMSKQALLAHQNYLATHRPRLTVRFVNCTEPKANERPAAEIRVANVGYTDAKIVSIGADIFRRTEKRIAPDGWCAIPQTIPLNPLAEPSQELVFTVTARNLLSPDQIARVTSGDDELCLIGIILYEDHNGTKRATSFFRIYSIDQKRYTRAGPLDAHADYEYEN